MGRLHAGVVLLEEAQLYGGGRAREEEWGALADLYHLLGDADMLSLLREKHLIRMPGRHVGWCDWVGGWTCTRGWGTPTCCHCCAKST